MSFSRMASSSQVFFYYDYYCFCQQQPALCCQC